MKTITMLIVLLAIGCGNNRNPMHVSKEAVGIEANRNLLQLTNIVFAPAAKTVATLGVELDLSVSSDIVNGEVVLSFVADEGALVSGDIILISLEDPNNGESSWGQIQVPEGVNPILSTDVELAGFPSDEEIVIIVRIERDGSVISESRTDNPKRSDTAPKLEITNTTYRDEAEIENVTVTGKTLTITFNKPIEITNKQIFLNNLMIIDEYEGALEIRDISESNGNLVIVVKDEIQPSDYIFFYYGNRAGFELPGISLKDSEGAFTLTLSFRVGGGRPVNTDTPNENVQPTALKGEEVEVQEETSNGVTAEENARLTDLTIEDTVNAVIANHVPQDQGGTGNEDAWGRLLRVLGGILGEDLTRTYPGGTAQTYQAYTSQECRDTASKFGVSGTWGPWCDEIARQENGGVDLAVPMEDYGDEPHDLKVDILANSSVAGHALNLTFWDDAGIKNRLKALQSLSLVSHQENCQTLSIDDIVETYGRLEITVEELDPDWVFQEGVYTLTHTFNQGLQYDGGDMPDFVFTFSLKPNSWGSLLVNGADIPSDSNCQ